MLTRDAILAANDIALEEVAIPEWGGSVYVRQFKGTERMRAVQLLIENGEDATVDLIIMCVTDADGKNLFTADDASALAEKNSTVLDTLGNAIAKVNFFGVEGTDEAGNDSSAIQS